MDTENNVLVFTLLLSKKTTAQNFCYFAAKNLEKYFE